jgi:hypothetical protein
MFVQRGIYQRIKYIRKFPTDRGYGISLDSGVGVFGDDREGARTVAILAKIGG